MHIYRDRDSNQWEIELVGARAQAMHKGEMMHGWKVSITSRTGARVEHQSANLAEAIAQAVAKADWLKRERESERE